MGHTINDITYLILVNYVGEVMNKIQKVQKNQESFTEDVVTYFLYREIRDRKSKVFFKIKHNISIDPPRNWYYCCGPDIDVLEVMHNEAIVGYEIKGMRKYKGGYEAQGWYEGLDEALAYLVLPHIVQNKEGLFDGGVFDHIYLVQGRQEEYIGGSVQFVCQGGYSDVDRAEKVDCRANREVSFKWLKPLCPK
ncbi:MAG: hypothetical protein HXY46_14840, partial [Syntrophaceae bacterium]|nr:hypothetical protein [Syntrophaceae bacterium]